MRDMLKEIEGAAQALSVRLQLVEARDPNDFDRAFLAISSSDFFESCHHQVALKPKS
jgi:hypothetical protein